MNAKERFYSAMARETIHRITANKDNWTSFLSTMGRNYEFTYPEQVMIFAQRPGASFCKSYEDWNTDQFRRYVRRGSKGIALFAYNGDKPYLRYVFDVADTGRRRTAPDLTPWSVKDEYREPVGDALEKTFGVKADGGLEYQLEQVAASLAGDYWEQYKNQILDIVENSFLEEYDNYNIEVSFKKAVTASVTYAMYTRCNVNPDDYFEHEDFMNVFDFNTRQTVNALGTAVSTIASQMFTEIERTITAFEQSRQAERSQNYDERIDLHAERGLSHPGSETGAYRDEAPGQVRQDAQSVPAGEQSDAVERSDSDGTVIPAPAGDRRDSTPESGTADESVPAEEPGTGQSDQSVGLGSAHERIESPGRGSSDDGAYQQLTLNLFLPEEEQIRIIDEAESKQFSAFSFSQEEIDHALILGSNADHARMLVVNEFAKQKSVDEIADTLQSIYKGGFGFKENGKSISCWYAEDGIHMAVGRSARYTQTAQIISWAEAADRIGHLLEDGKFATNVELAEAQGHERKLFADSLWYMYRDFTDEAKDRGFLSVLQDVRGVNGGFPEETTYLTNLLTDEGFRNILKAEYKEFLEAYHNGEPLLRFRFYKPDEISRKLNDLDLPRREYQTDMMDLPVVGYFITDDEINTDIAGGSDFSGGKSRIYDYFVEPHSQKEKAEFLKKEYGIGGHSHALSGSSGSSQDHDAKGLRYKKAGCEEVKLSWTQVAARVDDLVKHGRYFSEEVLAQKQAQQEEKELAEQDAIRQEQAQISELVGTDERFAVIDTGDGEYAIWDEKTGAYYVDPEGVTEYFDDEWLANEYLEQVRQDVAAMESLEPAEPVTEPDVSGETWHYQVGDTVYLDDTAFLVEQITDREVQLRDPSLLYPIFRAENRDRFEQMLSADERNHALRSNENVEARDYSFEYQLLDRLRTDCEYFLGEGQRSEKNLWAGNVHAQIAKMRELYDMLPEPPEWLTKDAIDSYAERMAPRYLVAAYHHFENGFDDKLDYQTLEEAERAAQGYVDGTMEPDGFQYDGAAVYDQLEKKCVRIYGDYPDEKAHAQVEELNFAANSGEVAADHFIDHFYVVEDLQKQGALDIKEYGSFEDAMSAYRELPSTQKKALGAMNTMRPLPGSLDLLQCVDGQDTVIEDYAKVAGWDNAEVHETLDKIEAALREKVQGIPAQNFRITDDNLGEGSPRLKYARNVAAIRTLFQLEAEGRNATVQEQEILSNYVGWGGLADVFDPNKDSWASEYRTLKELLSEEEYAAARASTLNAHYTSPTVIRGIYDAVERMGFETGNILEPAMGVGNFFGLLPESMRDSRLYGVELDPISGRIAQKLYPKADITVAGFETTDRRDFYDLAVGNVPFGNYKVSDKPYDKLGFSIHNYFFAKTLDQVRPGGVVAFVTSRFTMDSKNSDARRYMAERADFLGAIRLPNDAFRKNAGTDVVSDIIFLQKRDHPVDMDQDWVHLNTTPDGFTMNSYFVDHPEMILGELSMESTQYGKDDLTVNPIPGAELSQQLKEAVSRIGGVYQPAELSEVDQEVMEDVIPADPSVKNFSYAVVDGEVYFRENSIMRHLDLNEKAKERVAGMVELRRIVNELIEYQLEDFPDEMISQKQLELNEAYDSFTAKYGLINSRANGQAFSDDSSYYLLCSLENVDEDGKLKSKADMFTKRTIKPERKITSVDTPSEALAISIGEHGRVDLPYMSELLSTPGDFDAIITELRGVIFKDPMAPDDIEAGWQTSDEYLSGDVRSKLKIARMAMNRDSSFVVNVEALEKAQPKDLDASEIDVRLGATWVDPEYIQQFMQETFETPYYLRRSIEVKYSEMTAEWRITGKSSPNYNDVAAYVTYGTERANAYRILEETLNLKDIRIYDTIEDADGKQKRVLNKKETTLAQQKQQAIKDAFRDWIWKDPHRREALVTKYNELFNSTRPREYDGSHIRFGGMNPDITLREHQRNAIAHVLYGGNTLLAHEVGAGKTFEMAASAMESKRLGLCQKSMFVVPNHLTLQWANEFLRLYPSAKLLVASKKDFETANRKKFCARIATGDYDAVIIGHSQFEKIPLSPERQERQLREQIDEIEGAIAELKYQRGENFTIKQMEKTRKSLEARLDKLLDADRKDDVITFEQLGVDRLFVDESHAFKNLFLYTKMRNVAGLSTSEAQKSSDMFMKCRYMDELTGGRGVIFATGTPVSNSMTELYTVMRYLQYGTLQKKNLTHFDAWASTFGETTTAIELAPEGTGYRARTRFAKFFNLPELMNMFKEVADIKTSDQLDLPVPEAKFETVVVQPSDFQKDMVAELSERAAAVHAGNVDPSVDNMLKITSDGRKIGLDQRLMNPMLPDDPNSKLNACIRNVLRIYEEGSADKLTQLVFCDLSTPKKDGTFNVYDDIRAKLMASGVPEKQIAFIHDADTEAKKKELFSKVRSGQVRVLLGSTQKMGAGTNVQDRLVAVHHLDVGWRPSDMTQRNGRIIRQGNQNKEVQVYQYVTEGTFDAYLYQTLENKQKFISQIMTSKSPVRSCDDVDEQALSYAEIKALCAGNPLIKEKMDLDIEVARLKVLKADYKSQQYRMEDKLLKYFPAEIEKQTGYIHGFEADIQMVEQHPQASEGFCGMELKGRHYADKQEAGEAILAICKESQSTDPVTVGSYRGFQMELSFDSFRHEFDIVLKGAMSHRVALGTDARGNLIRLDNALAGIPERLERAQEQLTNLQNQQEATKAELGKPFPQEFELAAKSRRLAELDAALNMEETVEGSAEHGAEKPSVLADLKSKAEHISPASRQYERREEVL